MRDKPTRQSFDFAVDATAFPFLRALALAAPLHGAVCRATQSLDRTRTSQACRTRTRPTPHPHAASAASSNASTRHERFLALNKHANISNGSSKASQPAAQDGHETTGRQEARQSPQAAQHDGCGPRDLATVGLRASFAQLTDSACFVRYAQPPARL